MRLAISAILLLFFLVICIKLLMGDYLEKRIFALPDYPEYSYEMNPLMAFVIFIVITGPFFLVQPFSLLKYGVYFGILIILLLSGKIQIPKSPIVVAYTIFYIWLLISAVFFSSQKEEAMMLLIKYLLPLFSLFLGYSAVDNKYDLYNTLKIVAISIFVMSILFGGISQKLMPWLYYGSSGIILVYAGFTDYLSALFIVPLVLWWWTAEKKWLVVALFVFISPLLQSVRTGLGAMSIAGCLFVLFRYRFRSIPFLALIAAVFIEVILYVPEVNEKFFANVRTTKVTTEDIIHGDALSLDNINTNARTYMWKSLEKRFYKGHEMFGSGLGESTKALKEDFENHEMPVPLMHSDYVQLKCDTGNVGLWLFILFGVMSLLIMGMNAWKAKDMTLIVAATLAIGSMGATAFSMAFDNVVAHSMSSMIMPFIFIGMFLKLKVNGSNELISECEV